VTAGLLAPARPEAPARPSRGAALLARVLPGTVAVLVALGLWELAPRLGWVREQSVPPFSATLREAGAVLADPVFAAGLAASAGRWAAGLGLAVVIGVPLGLVMARVRVVRALVDPVLTLLYPVPKVAFVLLFVLWFGAGWLSQVLVIVLGSLIPLVVSAYHGAAGVDERLVWSARALGTGRWRTVAGVVLPAALPQVLSGLRIAVTLSLFTLVASELLVRRSGVGAYLFDNLDIGQNLRVWGTGLVVATIGALLDAALVAAVRRTLHWFEGEV
jgi:NitT/TauT family transport system permease protein